MAVQKALTCPFDFLSEFDDWWYWHECVIYWKTSEDLASKNVWFRRSGWVPVNNDPASGGWTPDVARMLGIPKSLVIHSGQDSNYSSARMDSSQWART